MYEVKTYKDIFKIDDKKLEPFLEKYAHYIVPRKEPITLEALSDGTIKIGTHLRWKKDHFWIEGEVFGARVQKDITKEQAKPLLLDLGHNYTLALAVTAAGGKVLETLRTKLYADFKEVVLVFTVTPDDYYFVDLDKIYEVGSLETIEELVEKGRTLHHPYFDYTVYGAGAVVHVKNFEEYRIAVKKSHKDGALEISRREDLPHYQSGETVLIKRFPPEYAPAVIELVQSEETPYRIMKNLPIIDIL